MGVALKLRNTKMTKADQLEQDKSEWRARIDTDMGLFRDQLGFVAKTLSQSNEKIDKLIAKVDENTGLTKDVLDVAAAFRKVGIWSRFVASFVAKKAEWSLKAGRWTSFHIIRPIGFAAAGFVAIWQAWVQIPWHDLMRALENFIARHL